MTTDQTDVLEIPAKLPFLEALCWQRDDVTHLAPEDMLRCYERGWDHRGVIADLCDEERDFIRQLADTYGSWLRGDL